MTGTSSVGSGKPATFGQRLLYGLGRGALAVVGVFPERVAYGLAGGLGRLFYRCSGRRQRAAMHILRNAYPDLDEAERQRFARRSAAHVFKVALDSVRLTRAIESGGIARVLDLETDAPLPDGPFVGVTAHVGSWEVSAVMIAQLAGRPAHAIARGFRNPLIHRWMLGNRERAGFFVHLKRGGIRGLTRALRDGHVVMQVADQNQRLRGVAAPFFGQVASTNRSVAMLALRFNVPIVVGCAYRDGSGFRFKTDLEPAYHPRSTGDFEADVARETVEVNRRLEGLIKRHPEQYLWMHDRYKSAPEIGPDGRLLDDAEAGGHAD